MHIPIRVDYGVRALVDLAMHSEAGPVRAADIARRASIPEPYLAQVLLELSKSGLIRSHRGPQGGHVLAMDTSDIRLSMVMEYLGGAQRPVACLDDVTTCVHVPSCAQREVWRSVEQAVFGILYSTTIAHLVDRTIAIKGGKTGATAAQAVKVALV